MPATNTRPRIHLLIGTLCLMLLPVLNAAEAPKTTRFAITEQEHLTFAKPTTTGMAVQMVLRLLPAHLPAVLPKEATLTLADGASHILWEGPLAVSVTAAGHVHVAGELPPRAVESILICDRGIVSFANGAEPLSIAFFREHALKPLGEVVPEMGGKPFFFNLPEMVPVPAQPGIGAPRAAVEKYVIAVLDWDREVQTDMDEAKNILARARSLWRDLRTADRPPWPKPALKEFDALYDRVLEQNEGLRQARATVRTKAKDFIRQWNTAHVTATSKDRPFTLEFYRDT
jgi:hypothetical protein